MWIFTRDSFISVVEDQDDSRYLVSRARIKGDLEALYPGTLTDESSASDYRFRCWLKRELVVQALSRVVREIDYDNFKGSLQDRTRCNWYSSVWLAGADEQERRLKD